MAYKRAPILAFVSIKGGVGKTTLALETATSLANDFGKKVLLVDGNFSAPNIGVYFDLSDEITLQDVLQGKRGLHTIIQEVNGVDIAPCAMYFKGRYSLMNFKKVLDKMRSRYDYIIIDSSPNYEEMKPVIDAADKVFVVTTGDHVTLATSLKSAYFAKQQKTPVSGIIINKLRDRRYEYDLNDVETIFGIPVLARIPDDKKLLRAAWNKQALSVHDRRSSLSREVGKFVSSLIGEPERPRSFLDKLFPFGSVGKEVVNRDILRSELGN
jgi:pilus assembly protein CpaE